MKFFKKKAVSSLHKLYINNLWSAGFIEHDVLHVCKLKFLWLHIGFVWLLKQVKNLYFRDQSHDVQWHPHNLVIWQCDTRRVSYWKTTHMVPLISRVNWRVIWLRRKHSDYPFSVQKRPLISCTMKGWQQLKCARPVHHLHHHLPPLIWEKTQAFQGLRWPVVKTSFSSLEPQPRT